MDGLNNILQIPERCLINKKITKAFFKRNFELASSEISLLDDFSSVVSIDWHASISPTNSNIAEYRDEQNVFEEVQIISVQSTDKEFQKNYGRIADFIQKYIPYQILLCIWHDKNFVLNACDKKISQNESSKRIIEKRYTTEIINHETTIEYQQAFLISLNFSVLDKTNLKTYFDSYTQRIIALQTAALNGAFFPRTQSRTQGDMSVLEKIDMLSKEIQVLENQAKKESQLNLRVQLNTQIQGKRKQIEELKVLLTA